jgi:hypothetical protein
MIAKGSGSLLHFLSVPDVYSRFSPILASGTAPTRRPGSSPSAPELNCCRDRLKTALDILPEPAKVGPKGKDFAAEYDLL